MLQELLQVGVTLNISGTCSLSTPLPVALLLLLLYYYCPDYLKKRNDVSFLQNKLSIYFSSISVSVSILGYFVVLTAEKQNFAWSLEEEKSPLHRHLLACC